MERRSWPIDLGDLGPLSDGPLDLDEIAKALSRANSLPDTRALDRTLFHHEARRLLPLASVVCSELERERQISRAWEALADARAEWIFAFVSGAVTDDVRRDLAAACAGLHKLGIDPHREKGSGDR